MNSGNSKTSDLHRLLLNLADKRNLERSNEYVANPGIYYTKKNINESYKNNTFKISSSTWNEKFELPDRSYYVSDIQDYYKYIIKIHETVTDNLPIRIYVNKIENRITYRIKTRYFLEFLTPETMKLLGSTKSKIAKDESGENVFHLEITEVLLVHCTIVNNGY